jgi:hypothetical protein
MERSVSVALIGVVAEDQPQVPFADDQHPVKAPTAGAGDPPRCRRPTAADHARLEGRPQVMAIDSAAPANRATASRRR